MKFSAVFLDSFRIHTKVTNQSRAIFLEKLTISQPMQNALPDNSTTNKLKRSSLFWHVIQRRFVVSDRRFGTTYRSRFQRPSSLLGLPDS